MFGNLSGFVDAIFAVGSKARCIALFVRNTLYHVTKNDYVYFPIKEIDQMTSLRNSFRNQFLKQDEMFTPKI